MARKPAVIAAVSQASVLAAVLAAMSAEPFYALLSPAEVEAAGADNIEVNADIKDGDKVAVRLSEAGQALAAATPAPAPTSTVKPSFEIEDNVTMPTVSATGGAATYPFANLNVGQSFHVPATAAMPNPAKSLASTVSSATARYAEETGETETVEVNVYEKDADGKNKKDADGKWIIIGKTPVTRPKMRNTRQFAVRAVDASDPKGVGARVWRTA